MNGPGERIPAELQWRRTLVHEFFIQQIIATKTQSRKAAQRLAVTLSVCALMAKKNVCFYKDETEYYAYLRRSVAWLQKPF